MANNAKIEAAIEDFGARIHSAFRSRQTMRPHGSRSQSKESKIWAAKYERQMIRNDVTALRAMRAVLSR